MSIRAATLILALTTGCSAAPARVSGGWARQLDLPLPRAGVAAAWLEDRLVVAGGSYWEAGTKRWTPRVDAFVPDPDRWETLPPLPAPVSNAASAADGRSLFILGGMGAEGTSARAWRLSRRADNWRWEPLPELPTPTVYGAAACVDGRLYLAGGAADAAELRTVTRAVYRLDLRRPGARWQPLDALPGRGRGIMAVAADRGGFSLFGGAYAERDPARVENLAEALRFDARSGRWRMLRPLPVALRACAAAALPDGRVVLVGGYSASADDAGKFPSPFGFERRVWVFQPRDQRYQAGVPLPAAVADGRAVYGEDRVWVVSGEDRAKSRTPMLASIPAADLLAARGGRPVWLCLGDSVTRGARSGVTEAQTYPAVLETLLEAGGGGPRVVNAGVGGETTAGLFQRLGGLFAAHERIDRLVVMYGLNDAALIDPGPTERTEPRVPVATYRENLRGVVREARRQGAAVVLCTPNPMTRAYAYAGRGAYARASDVNFVLKDYADAAREVAAQEEVPLVDVYRLFVDTPGWERLLPDGIHPNPEGLAMIAGAVRRALPSTKE